MQLARRKRRRGLTPSVARASGILLMLGKVPQFSGLMSYYRNRSSGRALGLIEYKAPGNQVVSVRRASRSGLLGAGYILDSHAAALSAMPECVPSCGLRSFACSRGPRRTQVRHSAGAPVARGAPRFRLRSRARAAASGPAHRRRDDSDRGGDIGIHREADGSRQPRMRRALRARPAKGVAVGVNHNFLFTPGYESIRAAVKSGELGRIDHLSVDWHFTLPILQFGPFDNWMLAAPANIVFETGLASGRLRGRSRGQPGTGPGLRGESDQAAG